jgi:hypothetical protein
MNFLNENLRKMTEIDMINGQVCPPANTLSLNEIILDVTVFRAVNKFYKEGSMPYNQYWDEDGSFILKDDELLPLNRLDDMMKDRNEIRPPIVLRKTNKGGYVYGNGRHRHARLLIEAGMNPDVKIYEDKDYVIEKNPGPRFCGSFEEISIIRELISKDSRYLNKTKFVMKSTVNIYFRIKAIDKIRIKIQRIPKEHYTGLNDKKNTKWIDNYFLHFAGEGSIGRETLNKIVKFRIWDSLIFEKKLSAQVFDSERKRAMDVMDKADDLLGKVDNITGSLTTDFCMALNKGHKLLDTSQETMDNLRETAKKSNNVLGNLEKVMSNMKDISNAAKMRFDGAFTTLDMIADVVGLIDTIEALIGSTPIMAIIRIIVIITKVLKYLIHYFPFLKEKLDEILNAFQHARQLAAESGSIEQLAISAFLVSFLPARFLKIFKDIPILTSFKLLDDTTWCYDLIGWILDLPVVILKFVGAPIVVVQFVQKLSTIFPFTKTSVMKKAMRFLLVKYTKDNRVIGQTEFRIEVEKLKEKVDEWLVDIHDIKDGLPQGLKETILSFQSLSKKSKDYDQTTRKEPIFFCFDGPPGCGKSTLMRDLIKVLEPYHTIYTHSSPSEGKDFYDLYNGEDIFVMDDIGQKGNAQWGNIINMVSTIKFPLDAAEVNAKGTKFFTSDLMLGTTNNIMLNLTQSDPIREVGAVYRRIDRINMAGVKFEGGFYSGFLEYEKYDILEKMWRKQEILNIEGHAEIGSVQHGKIIEWIFGKIKNKIAFKKKIFSQAPSNFDFGSLNAEVGIRYESNEEEVYFDCFEDNEQPRFSYKRFVDPALDVVKDIKEFVDAIPDNIKDMKSWIRKNILDKHKDKTDKITDFFSKYMSEIWLGTLCTICVTVFWKILRKQYPNGYMIIQPEGMKPFTVGSLESEKLADLRRKGIYYKILSWTGKELEDMFVYVDTPSASYSVRKDNLSVFENKIGNMAHKVTPTNGVHASTDFMIKNPKKKRTLAQLTAQTGNIQGLFTYFAEKVTQGGDQVSQYWTGVCNKHVRVMQVDLNAEGVDRTLFAVVFISGHYILGPGHLLDKMDNDYPVFATVYRDYNTIIYDKQEIMEIERNINEDWVLMKFKNKYLPNLHPKFDGFKSKQNLQGLSDYHILTPLGTFELGNKVQRTDFQTTYISLVGIKRDIVESDIMYNKFQGYGLCGSLIVASEGILLGMHVTGYEEDETGIAKVFSRTGVEKINNFLKQGQEMSFELKKEQGSEMRSRVLLDLKSTSNMNSSSRYTPSPLYGKVFDVTREPAVFNALGSFNETAKKLSSAAYQPVKSVDSRALKFATEYVSTLIPYFSKLDKYEVIKGNEILNPINKESSCGYLFTGFDKEDIFNYDNGTIRETPGGNKLNKRISEIWNNVKNNKYDFNIWYKECFKDELRNLNKVEKPRLFKASPVDLTYLTREFLGDLIGKLMKKNSRRRTGIMIGTNPFSADWKDLFLDLVEKSEMVVAGDWAKWDKAMLTQFQIALADEIQKKFTIKSEDEQNMMQYLLTTMYCSPTVTAEEMYLTTHSMPSGHGMTAIYNSLINKMYGAYIFYRLHIEHEQFTPTTEIYSNRVYDAVYGDDKLTASSYEWFDGLQMQKEALLMGLDFTPANKGEWKEGKCHILSQDCTFLKRNFFFHEQLGMAAPLEIEVLQASLNFVTDQYRANELTIDKIKNYQRELYLHGFKVYNTQMMYLLDTLNEIGFRYTPLSEEYLYKIYLKGLYLADQRQLYAESFGYNVLRVMSKTRDDPNGGLESLRQTLQNKTKDVKLFSEAGAQTKNYATDNKNTTTDTMSGFGIKIMTREPTTSSQREQQYSVNRYENTILEPSWTLANMLERPAFFGTIDWATTDAPHTVLGFYKLPFQFLQNQITTVPFDTFLYFRGDIELNIQVVATPLHQGMVKAVWVPLTQENLITQHIVPNFRALSMCQSVDLFPNANTTATMSVSFTYQREYINTKGIDSNSILSSLGYLYLVVFNPLEAAANSSSKVTISTFGQIKNAEFKVPRRPLQAQALGFLAGPLTSIIKSILPKKLVNDPIGEAVNFATNLLDKPNNPHIETPVLAESVGELNNTRGIEYARKMVLEPSEVAVTRGDTFGTEHDEMTFDDLKKRFTYMGSFDVTVNDIIGSNLAGFPIRPITYTKFQYSEPIVPTLLEYITLPFTYWNGSLTVKIQAIATSLQTCKIFMAVHYGQYTNILSNLKQATSQYGVAFEINQGSNEFEFNIPFISEYHQLYVSNDNVSSEVNSMGMVTFYLMNNLVCPNNTPTTIHFNAYIAGGQDYQVNTLSPSNLCVKRFTPPPPSVLKAQSAAQPLITDMVDVQQTTGKAEILSPTEQNKTNDIIGSDCNVMSIQNLLKKYQLVRFITRKAGGEALAFSFPIQTLAFDTLGVYSGQGGLLQHFAAIYRLWKGPLRVKIVVECPETTTPIDVFFIPPGNFPGTTTNLGAMTQYILAHNRTTTDTATWITEVRTTGIQKTMTLEIPFTTLFKSLSIHKGPADDFGSDPWVRDEEALGYLVVYLPEMLEHTKEVGSCSIYMAFGDETRFGVPMTLPSIEFLESGVPGTFPNDYSTVRPEFSLTIL